MCKNIYWYIHIFLPLHRSLVNDVLIVSKTSWQLLIIHSTWAYFLEYSNFLQPERIIKKNQVDSFSNFAIFSAFVIGKISKAFMNFELSLTFVIKPTNYWKMIRGFEIGSWIPWSNILVKNSEGKKILQRKGNYVRIPKSLSSYSFHFFSKLTRLANPIFIVNHYDL